MASLAMAQAVLQHAEEFYDTGSWYVVAECWDVLAIAEELDRHEERTKTVFQLDTAAIAHFNALIAAQGSATRH